MQEQKKTILMDLDGVLNSYNGEYVADFIPTVRVDTKSFLENLSQKYKIKLFTSRNKNLAYEWLIKNDIDKYICEVTNTKEPAWLIVDDRCVKFNGNFEDLLRNIEEFEVWYK